MPYLSNNPRRTLKQPSQLLHKTLLVERVKLLDRYFSCCHSLPLPKYAQLLSSGYHAQRMRHNQSAGQDEQCKMLIPLLLIALIAANSGVADKEEHNPHEEGEQADAANPEYPQVIGNQTSPRAGKGHIDANSTGDQAKNRTEVEYPVGSQPRARKRLVKLVTDDDHINKEDHHRNTPDHRYRCLQNVVDYRRKVRRLEANPERVRSNDKRYHGKEGGDNALHQHSHPGNPVGVHFAHNRGHAPVQT